MPHDALVMCIVQQMLHVKGFLIIIIVLVCAGAGPHKHSSSQANGACNTSLC